MNKSALENTALQLKSLLAVLCAVDSAWCAGGLLVSALL
jgi:hypothetical protein